jgi:hypothetical protein
MKRTLLLFALFAVSCATPENDPGRQLRYYLNMPAEPGDFFTQGTLDGVNYRRLLRGAMAKDSQSLRGLFRYTATGQLWGEGGESNDDVLLQLLKLWGDAPYARVVAGESPNVRTSVVAALDNTWDRSWLAMKFPVTYHVAPHLAR